MSYRELDLFKARLFDNEYDTSKNLINRLNSAEFREWRKEEFLPIFNMIKIIHQSLLELMDNRIILSTYVSDHQADPYDSHDKTFFLISWTLIPIPDFFLISDNNFDLYVHIIYLELKIIMYPVLDL